VNPLLGREIINRHHHGARKSEDADYLVVQYILNTFLKYSY